MFPVVNFIKYVVTEVVLFSVVAKEIYTDISQGSLETHLRCVWVGSLVTVLLQIFS